MASAGNQFLSLKTALISSGVLSLAVLITVFSSSSDFAAINEAPSPFMNRFSALLKPPYLYILVNFIIISIVASSKLHDSHRHHSAAAVKSTTTAVKSTTAVVVTAGDAYNGISSVAYGYGGEEDHVRLTSGTAAVSAAATGDVLYNDITSVAYDYGGEEDHERVTAGATAVKYTTAAVSADDVYNYNGVTNFVYDYGGEKDHNRVAAGTVTGGDDYDDNISAVYDYGGGDEDHGRVVNVKTEYHRTVENVADVAGLAPLDDDQKEVMRMDGGDGGLKGVVRIDSMEMRVMDEKLEALKRKVKEIETEKDRPLSSTKFHHRNKTSYDGVNAKSLRVLSKPKRDDTLENTWKTITDGRSIPLTRHLKKVDTCDAHVHTSNDQITPQVKKSETYNASSRSGLRREPSVKLKKDPSLSQDELNRRVEAFIDKFNEEMRLQRKQSLMNQEMLKRGVIIQ